jgi:hypothetical protein
MVGQTGPRNSSRSVLPYHLHAHELAPLALQNPATIYGILFRAVSESSRFRPPTPYVLQSRQAGETAYPTFCTARLSGCH